MSENVDTLLLMQLDISPAGTVLRITNGALDGGLLRKDEDSLWYDIEGEPWTPEQILQGVKA